MKYTKPRRKVYKKKPLVKKAIRQVKEQIFTKKVQKAISKTVELKKANYSVNNFALTSVSSGSFSNTVKILNPSSTTGALYFIAQGNGQGNRQANVINTRRLTIGGVIHINTTWDGTANYNMCPLYVALYIVKLKPGLADTVANLNNVIGTTFFQAGNVSVGFDGTLRDLVREPNNNAVTVLMKKVVKVGTATVPSAFAVNSGNNSNQQFGDSTVGISKMFKINATKYIPKRIYFNDTDNAPNTRNTYFFWVPLRVDGGLIQTSGGLATGTVPAYVDFSIDYSFTDI